MAARISTVKGTDRDWFHDIIRRCIANAGPDLNMREVGREAIARVELVASATESEEDRALAIRVLRGMAEDGAGGQVDVVVKEERVPAEVVWDGEPQQFTIPAFVAVLDPLTHAWNHRDHEELPPEQYRGYVKRLKKGAERANIKIAAHEAKLTLLDQFPEAISYRHALRLAAAKAAGQMGLAI